MEDLSVDMFGTDPIIVIVQTLLEKPPTSSVINGDYLRNWDTGGTSLDDLVHNMKLVNSLKVKPKELNSIRSSLSHHFEALRLFFVKDVYKRILLGAHSR